MITLATLEKATEQEVFDQVAKHMLAQGVRSRLDDEDHTNVCMYRGPNGLKCAAGCLIGDDEYTEKMDNNNAGTSWEGMVKRGEVPKAHAGLIQELQSLHDHTEPEEWAADLAELASDLGLNYSEQA